MCPSSATAPAARAPLYGAGSAVKLLVTKLIETAKPLAAAALGADAVEYRDGKFEAGSKSIGIFDLAKKLAGSTPHPMDCVAEGSFGATFPNGCHIAEVEIDPETGVIDVVNYATVDDIGNVVDHTSVEGQVHAGCCRAWGRSSPSTRSTIPTPATARGQLHGLPDAARRLDARDPLRRAPRADEGERARAKGVENRGLPERWAPHERDPECRASRWASPTSTCRDAGRLCARCEKIIHHHGRRVLNEHQAVIRADSGLLRRRSSPVAPPRRRPFDGRPRTHRTYRRTTRRTQLRSPLRAVPRCGRDRKRDA